MKQVFLPLVLLCSIVSAPAQSYLSFTFDPAGSKYTTVAGINNNGQIAGNFADAAGTHAFVRTGADYTIFDAPGSSFTVAAGINNLGQITGNFTDAAGTHGYI